MNGIRNIWRKLWPTALVVALVIVLAGGSAACSRSGADGDEGEKKEAEDGEEEEGDEAVPIEVATLGRGLIESVLRFSTNLEAEGEVQVFSEAARQVRQLTVEEGDDVRRGQVLIRLQNEAQQTSLTRVESQLAKARKDFERQESLYRQNLISEQVYNTAVYDIEQLELALADAKRELSYTEVRAPISGTVTERFVNVGDHVTVNQHLFDIVDFNSIVARVYVPEKELGRIRVGQDARLFADATGRDERRGTVDRIAPRVDPRSGTVKVTISIPRNQELLPGMYVAVELITEVHGDAILLPKKALVYDASQIFVFRMDGEDRVERLMVVPALEDRDNIEPAGGLEEGDQIVLAGQASLKDGSLVRIVGAGDDDAGEDGSEDLVADAGVEAEAAAE
jgi:membrane fusion protein (multidrug efflux system)